MSPSSHALRLSGYYFCFFWIVGILVPFMPVWFAGRGLSAAEIGLILAAALWTKIPVGLLLTGYADHSGERRRLLLAISLCVALGLLGLSGLWGFWPLLLAWLVVGTLITSAIPLTDSLALLSASRSGTDYGRVRLWGSISFIAASIAGGWLLRLYGSEVVIWLLFGGALAVVMTSMTLPNLRVERRQRVRPAALDLMRQPVFCLFAATAALLQSSHAALYAFATLHWRQAGVADGTIGFLWAEGVLAEILLFSFAGRLVRRLGVTRLFLLAAAAGILRWSVLGLTTEIAWLIAVQLLHALTFTATHVAALSFLQQTVPEDQSASAQGLYDGLAMGLFFGIAMAAASWVYAAEGSRVFLLMAAFSGLGGLAALLLHRLQNRSNRQPCA